MRQLLVAVLGIVGFVAVVAGWMRFTRLGTGVANRVVNPWLVQRGLAGSGRSEIATLEHIGRRSGSRRLTPLHAIPTTDGLRFPVPLGDRSEWAKNVVAAGGCRVQFRDTLIELDSPQLLDPTEVPDLDPVTGRITEMLGWKYLALHRVDDRPGRLEPVDGNGHAVVTIEAAPSEAAPSSEAAQAAAESARPESPEVVAPTPA